MTHKIVLQLTYCFVIVPVYIYLTYISTHKGNIEKLNALLHISLYIELRPLVLWIMDYGWIIPANPQP